MKVPKARTLAVFELEFVFVAPTKKASQEMFLIVLMVAWTQYVDIHPPLPLEIIEFFAGHAAIARNGVASGYRCVALDLEFDRMRDPCRRLRLDKRSPFDLNSSAGFAQLTWFNYKPQKDSPSKEKQTIFFEVKRVFLLGSHFHADPVPVSVL